MVKPEIVRPVWWPGLLWLAGGLAVLGRVAAAQILFISLRRRRPDVTHTDLNGRVAAILQRLAVRRKIRLLQSPGLTGPIAFGILRPSVGLPADFAAKFSRAEQDAMLAHELAHLASRDPLWYLLADMSSAALWWHPQVWWARRRLHRASELAADEAAAIFPEGPAALAECLVTLGKQMTQFPAASRMGVEGGGFRSNLAERVQRLLRLAEAARRPSYGWRAHAAKLVAILAISAAAIGLSGCLQSRDAVKQPTLQANLSQSWAASPASTVWHFALPPQKPESPPAPQPVKFQSAQQPESPLVETSQPASPTITNLVRANEGPRTFKPTGPVGMETRTFRVVPKILIPILEAMPAQIPVGQTNTNGGNGGLTYNTQTNMGGMFGATGWIGNDGLTYRIQTNEMTRYATLLTRYFSSLGLNVTSNGAFAFFNNRTGDILVRATAQDLGTVARVLELLNKVPPQVQIDAKFVTLTQLAWISTEQNSPKVWAV